MEEQLIQKKLPITSEEFNFKKTQINTFIESKINEIQGLKTSVENLKNWLEKYPNKSKFLLDLLENLQKPHIEFFNQLFTALKHDVLYSEMDSDDLAEKANTVVFKSSFKSDKMALKILAQTPEGDDETITSGGEKNVIATGLRLLALWRLISSEKTQTNKSAFSHRNFAFMDEPDCWISQKALPHYVNLLNQIVHDFNQQVLLVTHHNIELFKPFARVYKITNNGSFSDIQLISEPEHLINKENGRSSYIKKIQLQNFKTFKNIDIELSPYFTVFVGESMAGKSAIMEAFNAIVNNQADDTVIRHYENKASVSLTVINEEIIDEEKNVQNCEYKVLWERVRKKTTDFTQKTRYRLFNHTGAILNEEYNSDHVPSFAVNTLKMKKIDGIDVHLGSQEDMNFLFSNNISDFDRAKILSLGKESAYINKMIDKLNQNKRSKQSEVKLLEKRYNQILSVLADNKLETSIDIDNTDYLRLNNIEYELIEISNELNDIDKTIQYHNHLIKMIQFNQLSIDDLNNINLLIELEIIIRFYKDKLYLINKVCSLKDISYDKEFINHFYNDAYLVNHLSLKLIDKYELLKEIGLKLKSILSLNSIKNNNSNMNLTNDLKILQEIQNNQIDCHHKINDVKGYLHKYHLLEQHNQIEIDNDLILLEMIHNIQNSIVKLPDLNEIINYGKELAKYEKELLAKKHDLNQINNLINILLAIQQFVLDNMPTCPTCGSSLVGHKH